MCKTYSFLSVFLDLRNSKISKEVSHPDPRPSSGPGDLNVNGSLGDSFAGGTELPVVSLGNYGIKHLNTENIAEDLVQ